MTSKLFSQLDIVAAAANMTIIAVDLSSADKRLRVGGNSGIPYNNSAGQLVGTTVVAGVTQVTGIPLLQGVNTFQSFNNFAATIFAVDVALLNSVNFGGFCYFGRDTGAGFGDGQLGAIGASETSLISGSAAGDCYMKTQSSAASLLLGSGSGAAAIKILGANAYAQGDLKISTVGNGLYIKEGANATMGTLTLNGTTGVVVSTTKVTANSRIFLTHNVTGGTPGFCYVDTRSAGTSFTVKGTAGDTSTVAWLIVETA